MSRPSLFARPPSANRLSTRIRLRWGECERHDGRTSGGDCVNLPDATLLREDRTHFRHVLTRIDLEVAVWKPKLHDLGLQAHLLSGLRSMP